MNTFSLFPVIHPESGFISLNPKLMIVVTWCHNCSHCSNANNLLSYIMNYDLFVGPHSHVQLTCRNITYYFVYIQPLSVPPTPIPLMYTNFYLLYRILSRYYVLSSAPATWRACSLLHQSTVHPTQFRSLIPNQVYPICPFSIYLNRLCPGLNDHTEYYLLYWSVQRYLSKRHLT